MGKTPDDDRYLVPGLLRGVQLLEAFGGDGGSMSLAELARAIGATRSATFRAAYTLTQLGLLRQDAESRAYRIGPAVAALAARYAGDRALLDTALPVLEALREQTGLSAQLGALEGGDVVYLLRLRGARAASDLVRTGGRLPAQGTAMGRMLLAAMDEAALRSWHASLPGRRLPWPALSARAREDAARGHVVQLGEFQRGIGGIAAAVRRADGLVVAALSLAGPATVLRAESAALVTRIRTAAARISPA